MNKLPVKILLGTLIFLIVAFGADRVFDFYRIVTRLFPAKPVLATAKLFSFSDKDSLQEWNEKILNGRTTYTIESAEGESYVRAVSDNSCSAMYYQIKLDPNRHPFLSWRWHASVFPDKPSPDNLCSKAEDDYAARMYVIFPAIFFANSKALEYVWVKDSMLGTITSSPYSANIKVIVLESGAKAEWMREERDIYNDYVEAFGTKPTLEIGAISFMCDSDSTKSKAEAFLDDIKIFYKKEVNK
ncbi:MAG: DUF3047 domain-containing protein [Candidatus Omnitrophica bacterium]|nr:DUF3047 domain-containing protein [Candidatus Omnitrophota bacterium]